MAVAPTVPPPAVPAGDFVLDSDNFLEIILLVDETNIRIWDKLMPLNRTWHARYRLLAAFLWRYYISRVGAGLPPCVTEALVHSGGWPEVLRTMRTVSATPVPALRGSNASPVDRDSEAALVHLGVAIRANLGLNPVAFPAGWEQGYKDIIRCCVHVASAFFLSKRAMVSPQVMTPRWPKRRVGDTWAMIADAVPTPIDARRAVLQPVHLQDGAITLP